MNFRQVFLAKLKEKPNNYNICGAVTQDGLVYPLGSDTKVLSSVFELITRPLVYESAKEMGYSVVEASVQNHYPDFTLLKDPKANDKIAIDVKTTYITSHEEPFGFTLGGYTSFLRNETKNIVFPFSHYSEHWVIGYVYERVATKKSADNHVYGLNSLADVPLPYKNVRVFVQEKWRISSDRAGSGNTTNIGSIYATLDAFEEGTCPFTCEEEFLEYWRGYGRTAQDRAGTYKNVGEFRAAKKR